MRIVRNWVAHSIPLRRPYLASAKYPCRTLDPPESHFYIAALPRQAVLRFLRAKRCPEASFEV